MQKKRSVLDVAKTYSPTVHEILEKAKLLGKTVRKHRCMHSYPCATACVRNPRRMLGEKQLLSLKNMEAKE